MSYERCNDTLTQIKNRYRQHLNNYGIDVISNNDIYPKFKVHEEADFDSFVCVDIETTGGKEQAITEIGAVRVIKKKITERYSSLINPKIPIMPMISKLTGITDAMVRNERTIDKVLPEFLEFAGDNILVGHNIISFDSKHIYNAGVQSGIKIHNEIFDTLKMARKIKKKMEFENCKLTYLADFFEIEDKEAHRAYCDAEVNAKIYFKLKSNM